MQDKQYNLNLILYTIKMKLKLYKQIKWRRDDVTVIVTRNGIYVQTLERGV